MPRSSGIILGIMPVVVDLVFTRGDGWETDDDVYIDAMYWQRKDGSAGSPVPQHVRDRADKVDYLLCNLIEQAIDNLSPPEPDEPVAFELG